MYQPDLWHVLGTGAFGKPAFRLPRHTGAVVCAADNLVASGMFDIVMAIGFENYRKPEVLLLG